MPYTGVQLNINWKKLAKSVEQNLIMLLVVAVLATEFVFPKQIAQAARALEDVQVANAATKEQALAPKYVPVVKLDEPRQVEKVYHVVGSTWMQVSAYNSLPGQTDGSPFITASSTFTRDGIVASNYFPIGTLIRFPDYSGDKVYRVEDRMNKRYNKVVDIWMPEKADAISFGRRSLRVEIVK